MTRLVRQVSALTLLVVVLSSAGCSKPAEPEISPKVVPPAIATTGELAVGVDLDLPPFAGTDEGQQAGLDIDVARALAERLGLTVKIVDVKPSLAATAIADGSIDVAMSIPLGDTSLSAMSLAGAYAFDGPVFFVSNGSTESVEPSLTVTGPLAEPIGVQRASAAYWHLAAELDTSSLKTYDTLRAALEALAAGEIDVVAGDAFVGSYIARDIPGIHFAGQVRPATALSVAVAADNAELGDAVREALDGLAADGVLDALRRKWVGELPELESAASAEASPAP